MAKWELDCSAPTKEPRSEGQDVVVRLNDLASYMFNTGHWGSDLDTVKDAIGEIVNLRIKLFVAQAPKVLDEETPK